MDYVCEESFRSDTPYEFEMNKLELIKKLRAIMPVTWFIVYVYYFFKRKIWWNVDLIKCIGRQNFKKYNFSYVLILYTYIIQFRFIQLKTLMKRDQREMKKFVSLARYTYTAFTNTYNICRNRFFFIFSFFFFFFPRRPIFFFAEFVHCSLYSLKEC